STKLNVNLVCYKGHNYPVWDVQFSPVGHYFASASHDRTTRIWSMDKIQPLRIMAGHLSDVDCVQWHVNCNYIATGSSDKTGSMPSAIFNNTQNEANMTKVAARETQETPESFRR
ncbi:hypothetical protein E2562_014674, partial [Oryza meyeriana var. granulata]